MPKTLDRPEVGVDTRAPVVAKPPVARPPAPPVRREPQRFVRWLGLLVAFLVAVSIAAIAWVNLASDDDVSEGEPWTAQARGLAEFTVEPGEPWSPATRGLTRFALRAPWNPVDRGIPTTSPFDVPWTAELRGMP